MEPAPSKGYEVPLAGCGGGTGGLSAGADGAAMPGSQPSPAAVTDCPTPPPPRMLHQDPRAGIGGGTEAQLIPPAPQPTAGNPCPASNPAHLFHPIYNQQAGEEEVSPLFRLSWAIVHHLPSNTPIKLIASP